MNRPRSAPNSSRATLRTGISTLGDGCDRAAASGFAFRGLGVVAHGPREALLEGHDDLVAEVLAGPRRVGHRVLDVARPRGLVAGLDRSPEHAADRRDQV